MKRNVLVSSVLGVALAGLMVTGAAAQKSHGNSGTNKQTGLARAEEVQNPNGDKDRKGGRKNRKNKKGDHDPAASTNKTEGNHKAKGHSH